MTLPIILNVHTAPMYVFTKQIVAFRNLFEFSLLRLLTQVRDMETAFDGFWEKHQLKMEQYLQLWKFEQDFQQVSENISLYTFFHYTRGFYSLIMRNPVLQDAHLYLKEKKRRQM